MRARMALSYANIKVELREILLSDRPKALYDASEKGTVPVLQLANGTVIDESFDIMVWALNQTDTDWKDLDLDKQLAEEEEMKRLEETLLNSAEMRKSVTEFIEKDPKYT